MFPPSGHLVSWNACMWSNTSTAVWSSYVDFRMAQASLTDSISLIKEKALFGMLFPSAVRMVYSLSPDLAVKHASTNTSPEGLQLESTETMPIANVPTVVGYITYPLNAQLLLRKHATMCRTSRWILSQYLQSLKKVCPLLATTQSARSSRYPGGQGNLGLN